MGKEILSIFCPSCGAPAKFDIIHQIYQCGYCGGKVEIEEARREKVEFQKNQNERIRESAKNFEMSTVSCSGCGATLVFEKDEALSNCTFCGRNLVRKDYVYDSKMPKNIIPFAVTKNEAEELLKKWCEQNRNKIEAKHLMENISKLKGYYLPYEMVHGPVYCKVYKIGDYKPFKSDGYLNDEFVNCSSQLDNLVLDSMEPYNLNNLKEFDFSYVAGQRIKISDISEKDTQKRLNSETEKNYRGSMEKIWGTKAININVQVDPVVKIPVLLPVYYITEEKVLAAVNGQTGKISVRAEKDSKYISIPWWLKAILVLITVCVAIYFAFASQEDITQKEALFTTGSIAIMFLIIFAAMFEDASSNGFSIVKYRNIFSTGDQTYRRKQGKLVLREDIVKRKIEKPVFREKLEGKEQIVTYTFRSLKRTVIMLIAAIGTIYFPVIIALFINGFDFARLDIRSSAIWFCITVPTVPIAFIKYGIQSLYASPWIYIISKNGKKKRYRKKSQIKVKEVLKFIQVSLFFFPICLLTWFAILMFIMTVYFTAFGN